MLLLTIQHYTVFQVVLTYVVAFLNRSPAFGYEKSRHQLSLQKQGLPGSGIHFNLQYFLPTILQKVREKFHERAGYKGVEITETKPSFSHFTC